MTLLDLPDDVVAVWGAGPIGPAVCEALAEHSAGVLVTESGVVAGGGRHDG